MANGDSDPGLRAAAESARASRRSQGTLAPPMPPDEMASPFARPRGPQIHSVQREVVIERANQPAPKAPKVKPDGVRLTDREKQREKATTLIDNLMRQWYTDAKHNISQADRKLAMALRLNGSALIECAYPIDSLNNLMSLTQRLLINSLEDDSGNEDALAVHEWMTRKDEPKPEVEEPDEE